MLQRRFILGGLLTIIITLFSLSFDSASQAQDEDRCPQVVELALEAVNQYCRDLDRNSACYGYTLVDATFNIDVPDFYFTQPADVAELLELETLQTAALSPDDDIWGLAVLNVQANIPNTLPGQGVVILLMGEAQMQNEVDPEAAFVGADPVAISTLASASNIRLAPSSSSLVLGSVPAGTPFEADGRSPDGAWLRVIFEGRPAWVSSSLVTQAVGLDTLPAIESGQYTPMQAFSFSTGIGQPTCNRAPNSIVIQGPENIDVTINANGADITIGSTIVLQTPADDTMQLLAVSGSAIIDGVTVPAGFTVSAALDEAGQAVSGALSGFRPLSDQELEQLDVLETINPDLLQYPIVRPTRAQIIRLQNAIRNRENAIVQCRAAGFEPQQCLRIIGTDGDLANRFQRCLDSRIPDAVCRSIIAGDINPQIVLRCLSEGFRSAEECREAYQDASTSASSTLEDYCRAAGANTPEECRTYCESQGYMTLADCQAAATNTTSSTMDSNSTLMQFCQAGGATNLQQCIAYCQSLGYNTLEECQSAASGDDNGDDDDDSGGDDDGGDDDDPIVAFCQSIGASTSLQCQQICNANGYTTVSECMAGMGG